MYLPVAELREVMVEWSGNDGKRWPFPQIHRTGTRHPFLVLAASGGMERCAFAAKKLRCLVYIRLRNLACRLRQASRVIFALRDSMNPYGPLERPSISEEQLACKYSSETTMLNRHFAS